jgi:hypothetical protein
VSLLSPDGNYLTVGGADHKVHVLDVSTGKTVRQFEGHRSDLMSLTFAPDGKSLASGSSDTTILIWKVDDLLRRRDHSSELSSRELEPLWNDLAAVDAAKAYRALATLAATPRSVAFLGQHLRPATAADPAQVARLIGELDSQRFAMREKAVEELAKLGELAEPALRKMLATQPSLEFSRRLEALRRRLEGPVASAEALRSLRALEVLERVDTAEARELLRKLAAGTPASWLTQGAQAAIQRLAVRTATRSLKSRAG